jgi:Domain of unknown function (DUF4279)
MKNNVHIDFQLLETTITPKEISAITKMIPDTELMRGERNEQLDLPRLNIWSKRSQADSDEIADHWANLEPILKGAKEAIKEIAKTGKAKLTIIITSKQRIPPITIPASMSEFAGFINAVIDIDHIQS